MLDNQYPIIMSDRNGKILMFDDNDAALWYGDRW